MQVDLRDDDSLEVQMAPLIDCVFLLLIFFLVASTLRKIDKELPLELPEIAASVEVQQPPEMSIVSIDVNGNFYLDGAPITVALLQAEFRRIAADDPQRKIRLDADRGVAFERVMMILDMTRFERLNNVSINSKRDEK
ncbi:MAG: ExbD/TolR family protein [Phycisphaeraceae bacterium JB051]